MVIVASFVKFCVTSHKIPVRKINNKFSQGRIQVSLSREA